MRIEFTPDHQIKILNKRDEKVDTRYGIKGLSVSEVLAEIFENLIKAGYSIPFGSYQINLISFNSNLGWGLISAPTTGHSPTASSSQELQTHPIAISFEWLSYIDPLCVEHIGHLLDLACSDGTLPPLSTDMPEIINHNFPGTGPIVNMHNAQLASILEHDDSSSSTTPNSSGAVRNFMPHYFLVSVMHDLDILSECPGGAPSPATMASIMLSMAANTYNPSESATSELTGHDSNSQVTSSSSAEIAQHEQHGSTSSSPSSSSSSSPSADHPLQAADTSSGSSSLSSTISTLFGTDHASESQPASTSIETIAPVVTVPGEHAEESAPSPSNILPTTLPLELDNPNPGTVFGALAGLSIGMGLDVFNKGQGL